MRSRSQSPLQPYQQTKKYYSREEVGQILRAMMETKLSKIYEEMEEKQHLIRTLNDKLNRNDELLQAYSGKVNQLWNQCERHSQTQADNLGELVSSILSDKLQAYWRNIQEVLGRIKTNSEENIRKRHDNFETYVASMVTEIRSKCEESVEGFKKKNNAYWIKVKEALGKISSRATQVEEKVGVIGMQINKYELQREENSKTLRELQNGQNTARMLVELKKSVNNVYKSFSQVLKLQETVKDKYEQFGSMGHLGRAGHDQPRNSPNLKRNDEIVILEYSVEEDTLSNPFTQRGDKGREESLNRNSRTRSHTEMNAQYPLSPITGKIVESSSLSNTMDMMGSERYKGSINTNTTLKNETHDWPENNYYMGTQQDQSNSSFQFAFHPNNPQSNSRSITNVSSGVSTSMLNFSMECRKEMIESVKPRLLEMIEVKGLQKPLRVFMDQINYLKNEEGNYIFDLKGNMFKISAQELAELEKDKILFNVRVLNNDKKNKKNFS